MILIYGTLGLSIFEKPKLTINQLKPTDILYLKGPNAEAQGQETNEGFIVFKDSKANSSETNSLYDSIKQDRKIMIDGGLLIRSGNSYVLTQDYSFSSPSRAAAIFLSRSSNGRTEWKTANGKTLKEIQDEK